MPGRRSNGSGCGSTAPRDRTAAHRPTRAESEKARRRGLPEAPRVTLRRAVSTAAAAASSEREFFARLDAAGVSVRKRFSTRNPGEVTGFAVALPADTTQVGGPVWYSGGKLAPDLSLPKLRHRWAHARASAPGTTFTSAERNALYDHAARTAADAAEQIKNFAVTDPDAAADAAWAAADTLHVTAKLLGNRVIRQAADAYDRAARLPSGRIPRPSPAGNDLRRAARLMARAALPNGDPVLTQLTLLTRLASLIETIADLREAQHHAARAAAARQAAEQLHTARAAYPTPAPAQRARTRKRAERTRLDFPLPPTAWPRETYEIARPGRRSSSSPRPPRPRGPTR